MSRYEVEVDINQHYSFAIEADDPATAQGDALAQLTEAKADHMVTTFTVELGADRG